MCEGSQRTRNDTEDEGESARRRDRFHVLLFYGVAKLTVYIIETTVRRAVLRQLNAGLNFNFDALYPLSNNNGLVRPAPHPMGFSTRQSYFVGRITQGIPTDRLHVDQCTMYMAMELPTMRQIPQFSIRPKTFARFRVAKVCKAEGKGVIEGCTKFENCTN